ncbi:TPM domain-containing protein [Herbiconiux sp.]|uniref:TPM domain-containing protein n=1 Tax=Herbiconiux sp. TaxID=1871186 RepID=UPI0025C5156C|nr:TPM domain-containing protein [Herbiconiux sp.]
MRVPHRTRRAATRRPLSIVFAAAAAATALLVVPGALLAPPAAHAGDPVSFDGRYVVDEAGVLGSDEGEVQDAVQKLATEQGVNLFVVYTDSFENPSDRGAWTDEVASINQFGTNDVLLAVAVDDRLYQLSVDGGFALDDEQLERIETDDIIPALRVDDWAGAAVAAAGGIDRELGGSGGEGTVTPGGIPAAVFWVVALVVIVLVAALVIALVVRRRRRIDSSVSAQAAEAGPTLKELEQRVGAVLVDLDDAVTSSEEELGFAVAQFGTEATATYTQVLAAVKTKRSEAFALKQRLDDAEPDTDEERRTWSEQIIAMCDEASDELDAQVDSFAALREVERDPLSAHTAAAAELAALSTETTEAKTRAARLSERYDAHALQSLDGSVPQLESLRVLAENELAAARTEIDAGKSAEAALGIRAARQAVGQSRTIVTAIAALESELDQAAGTLAAVVADAERDIAEAARLQAAGQAQPQLASLAQTVSVELERSRGIGARDPLTARASLEAADAPLDAALASVRDEQERAARLIVQRDRAIATAQNEVGQAQSFLQTRRGAVGPDARTRLSEAQRHLDQSLALATTDPEASLREATTASQLASRATATARLDVSSTLDNYNNYGSSYDGGGRGDDSFQGGLLGGILGGLLGGDSGGSSWSSGSSGGWGGGSRGGGYSSRSSSRRSSSSSSGSRRSSGGRSSGRRGGGGRF